MNAELLELLAWVARGPRGYAEAMDVWQTSCPRHSVWEDALNADLVQVADGERRPQVESLVTLTPRGRALLASAVCAERPLAATAAPGRS